MNIPEVVELIYQKGKQQELLHYLITLMPKLPSDVKKELCHKMEEMAYSMTCEEARQIVTRMIPYGEHWSMDKIKDLLNSKGMSHECTIRYYLVMNMMFNDYARTADAFKEKDNVDFYYHLSYDFINDADAPDFKVEKYFKM